MSLRLVLRWPLLAALLLAAFAVVLVSFEARPLQAQDPDIRLVNNRNVSGNASNSNDLRAQNFRTGANPDGYTISAVLIRLGSNSANKSTTVKIREHVPRENELTPARPGELVATLTSPTSLVSGDNTFTAPGGTTLAASTTYWITIGEGILKQNRAAVVPVTGDGQSGEPGWTIGNNSINRDSETDDWGAPQSSSLRMEIRGFIAADATLSGLALEADYDASKLVPVFASDIFDYTAKVAGRNDAVTLTATATQSTMTVAITSDADSGTPDEAVLALNVGSNTLTVTVTSEDGSGTRIYTITATRSEPPTAVPHDWDLIPNGRTVGDEFRLIFLSSLKRQATDTDIESYNTWIQDLLLDHGHSAIQDYRSGFRVVGCTADVDARDNIDTTDFRGVHIYWLNGAKVANGYAGFYNGSWDDEANNRNQSGTDSPDTSIEQNFPYTGCRQNGTEMRAGGNLRGLGSGMVRVGRPDNDTDDVGPIDGGVNHAAVNLRPIYGISQIFVVAAEGEVSTDARLSALTVNDGTSDLTLRPSFAPGTTAYAADVGATVTSVTLTPTTSDADATIEYLDGDDNALSHADPFQFDLVVGENTIKMRVKATDNFTTRTYTLQVSRNTPATGAPHINGVAVVGQMLSAWTTGISDVDGTTKADNGRAGYAYTYQWERVDADGTSNGLNIAGATEQTYTVIGADVGRKIRVQVSFSDDTGNPEGPLVSDAFPSSRTVTCADIWCATLNVQPLDSGALGCANSSAGDLCSDEPQLSEDEFRHASTDYSVTSVNVQSNGQLQFRLGEPIAAGSESLVLHVGSEMFAFQEADVKDESSRLWNNSGLTWSDGDAVELKLTLGASIDSTDATLSALTVNDGASDLTLTPNFAPDMSGYAADVGAAIDTVTLTATVNHSGARVQSVTLDGTPIADTDFSDGITVPSLVEDANVIAVIVTAEDGTSKTYTITVTRAVPSSTDATLSALTVNDGASDLMLTPNFAPDTLGYAADVDAAIDTVTLTATVNHSGASVTSVTAQGEPIADTDFSDGITVPSLVEDANVIAVSVTAEDGTQKTYTITVTRAVPPSTDATLSALTVNDGTSDLTLTPNFAPDTSGYAADVGAAIDTVTLTATVNHSGASVTSVTAQGERHRRHRFQRRDHGSLAGRGRERDRRERDGGGRHPEDLHDHGDAGRSLVDRRDAERADGQRRDERLDAHAELRAGHVGLCGGRGRRDRHGDADRDGEPLGRVGNQGLAQGERHRRHRFQRRDHGSLAGRGRERDLRDRDGGGHRHQRVIHCDGDAGAVDADREHRCGQDERGLQARGHHLHADAQRLDDRRPARHGHADADQGFPGDGGAEQDGDDRGGAVDEDLHGRGFELPAFRRGDPGRGRHPDRGGAGRHRLRPGDAVLGRCVDRHRHDGPVRSGVLLRGRIGRAALIQDDRAHRCGRAAADR